MKYVLAIAIAVLVVAEHRASANGCNEFYAQAAQTRAIPLGCPLTVYVKADIAAATTLTVTRRPPGFNQTPVPLLATVDQTTRSIDVTIDTIDGSCADHYTEEPTDYTVITAGHFDANLGDYIAIDGIGQYVTAAGPCEDAVGPPFYCTSPPEPCDAAGSDSATEPEREANTGCNAGGGSCGLGIALALLALRRRR